MIEQIIIFTDGGSRGNPGPSAAGFVLKDKCGNQLYAAGIYLGKNTNNFAEYSAIVKSLETASEIGAEKIRLYSDSELLVRQINGQYKVKSQTLRPLYTQVMELLSGFGGWSVEHVYREGNEFADELVNMALDKKADVIFETSRENQNKDKPIRLGVLISGGGTTLINLSKEITAGRLNAEIPIVISSRAGAAGVERARKAGLRVVVIRKNDFDDIESFSEKIEQELSAAKVELVVQAGWLCLWRIPSQFENKVMNIHPALLPGFGGKGMWGHHVHQAVLDAGVKVSGCTVHFCNNEYDSGPIIIQRCCRVEEADTADTLAERVFEQECIAYPEAIKLFIEKRLSAATGKVEISR
ncbi:MAG: phosphoribosylglycinamide formyltransferase [Planctomycetes bacterium]|nr:phosphoribosylglycinamide formyltransferase [Planctomycetota bacterium]MBL7107400.1 phosphoribosylglycinamide formyltransferase [Phycisphaerae bacterium]